MAWKEITNSSNSWDYQTNPELEGTLIEKKSGVGANNSKLYVVKTNVGELVGVWGSAVLDNKFASIAEGSRILIEYLGQKENPKTSRTYKDFRVSSDSDI